MATAKVSVAGCGLRRKTRHILNEETSEKPPGRRKAGWGTRLIRVTAINSAAILRYFRTPLSSCCGGEIDARDLGDGLPGGFLVGAIVKVRVALRLNWACELALSRGEELA
jgi:hypothetical protein